MEPLAAALLWSFGLPFYLEPPIPNLSEISVLRYPVPVLGEQQALPSAYWFGSLKIPVESEPLHRDHYDDLTNKDTSFWDAALLDLHHDPVKTKFARVLVTVYYTPRESGFTAERGFDMTQETRSGLGGRYFSKDFLRAVTVEGFGVLAEPYNGKKYIKYDGRWGYGDRQLGNRNNTLVPRVSVAAHRRSPFFQRGKPIRALDDDVYNALGSIDWELADTGGGLNMWQLDLFWGVDDPLGPGMDRFRPMGCPLAVKFWVLVAH
ncbi:MAG: hypothetical protein AAGA58_00260 [Verrucomicrobiota bacterium]